jgi:hypothetical protein
MTVRLNGCPASSLRPGPGAEPDRAGAEPERAGEGPYGDGAGDGGEFAFSS